ncbi:MAG: hypothetical protein EOO66_05660 [Methylobacterium sp.]|nr:MAG: hypothetical protein EOO66_05660 [Methylobacterium sp.]
MSDNVENNEQPGLSDEVQEIQANFPNDAALQEAINKLEHVGFDRADLSLPDTEAPVDTPDSAEAATDHIDRGQLRTMASGMAGTAAGFAAAGALLATSVVAAPVAAAIGGASAIGTVLATSGTSNAVDAAASAARDKLGAEDKLILAVRIRSTELKDKAEAVLREAGATALKAIVDASQAKTRGTSSTSWTG